MDFTKHVVQLISIFQKTISSSPLLTKEINQINTKGERPIAMDVEIEKRFIDYVKKQNLPVIIFSEEIGLVKFHPKPTHILSFDPLDGSTNYKVGKGLLPFGTLIAIYEGTKPYLNNIVASGAYESTRNLGWIFDGKQTKDLKGRMLNLKADWTIDRHAPFYVDLYWKEGYEVYRNLPEQIFIRNTGSTIGNLSYLLSNVAAGFGFISMKAEEVGAVYSLIKGAGGVIVDHQNHDLGKRKFEIDSTYEVLGGNQKTIAIIIEQMKG